MVIKNFDEAHTALRAFYANARVTYDLRLMQRLMDYLGNPQDKLRVIHIAGTSGKTSTAYYAAALLETVGAKVGLTVSPHVDEVNERVQINLQPLAEREFCKELTEFLGLIKKSGLQPSYFEVMVAFAYWEFVRKQVDYAVVEVGLGGLLDGTNVVTRKDKVCIITDIGLDHTEILGETLAEIAAQKAGIIHPGNEVFMYEQGPEVMLTVQNACSSAPAQLHIVPSLAAIRNESLPLFQQRNLGLAVQVVNFVVQRDRMSALQDEQVVQAANIRIPARMERFSIGDKVLIVDGSHNGQKLATLAESVKSAYPGEKVAALTAFVDGPESRWQGGLVEIFKLADSVILTEFRAEQDVPKESIKATKLQEFCKSQNYESTEVIPDAASALDALLARSERVLLVAGSFYLLNSVRPLIVKR